MSGSIATSPAAGLRPNYFQRQLLGAADFIAEQAYHRGWRRRHNLGPHLWGVVTGLELLEIPREGDAEFRDIILMPGLAVDLYGREILVPAPTRIDPALFAALAGDQKREVWIRFDERALVEGQAARLVCQGTDLFSRVAEGFRLAAGPQPGELWDLARALVVVGGEDAVTPPAPAGTRPEQPVLPADGSEPAQEFEAPGENPIWLLRLGSLRWDGGAAKFRPVADPAHLSEGRVWAGMVGASLLSESGGLRLAPRTPFADADAQDFAALEGRLTLAGRLLARADVELHGGRLRLRTALGGDENAPLWAQRRAVPGEAIAADLHLHIGDDEAAAGTRFSVGAGVDETVKPVLAVRADRKVDLPESGKLRFTGGIRRQAIDLSLENDARDGAYGIGVQDGAQYTRTANEVYWYRGGVHDDAAGAPGAGGDVLLRLDGQGRLRFGSETQQMLNLWRDEYGIGVQAATLYFRSNFDFAWHRGGTHADASGEAGAGGERLLLLSRAGRMFFGNRTQQMLNLWGEDYGVGVQSSTLYQRSNADFAWYRGGTHSDIRGDGGGGTRAMRLDAAGLSVAGQVDATGDVRTRGQVLRVVDAKSGFHALNETPGFGSATRSGQAEIDVTSDIDFDSLAFMVGLADISNVNVATDARWRVAPDGWVRLAPNRARLRVDWRVDDTDGMLRGFTWLAVFTA